MRALLVILLAISFMQNANAENACRKQGPTWYSCKKDSDCMIIHDPCGYPIESSNVKFSKSAEDCNRIQGAAMSCATWTVLNRDKAVYVPKCVDKICVAQKK